MNHVMQKYLTKKVKDESRRVGRRWKRDCFLEILNTCVRIEFNDVVGCKM